MCVGAGIAKPELKDSHARDVKALTQGMDVWRDVAEILGEKWETAKCIAQMLEQVVFWTIDPAAVLGGFVARGNLPELSKAAKMIEANVVEIVRGPAHAVDPPGITLRLHDIPAV